ncbi:MAG: HAD-IB family phosphatase, partial [Nanoarchaeota archaeon]|nr:HAD-IB family phosphatase [Nanoarchaeota archaeon]
MKYRLVCFSLGGTLVDLETNVYEIIYNFLNINDEERMNSNEDFFNERISYNEWFEKDVNKWHKAGATKDLLLEAIKDVNPREGALETIQKLKNNGLKILILSDGLDILIKKAFGIHQSLFDEVFINKLFFGEGGSIVGGKATPYPLKNKVEGLKEFAQKYHIDISKCVFIGNDKEDVTSARIAGLSMAFNSKSEALNQVSDIVIESNDI